MAKYIPYTEYDAKMKYFKMSDFTRSQTAAKYGIENSPETWQMDNALTLYNEILHPMCEQWIQFCQSMNLPKPWSIKINSGIRNEEFTAAIGEDETSPHMHGYAVDIQPNNTQMMQFKNFCISFLSDKSYDQFISEYQNKQGVPSWIHISYMSHDGKQRKENLTT